MSGRYDRVSGAYHNVTDRYDRVSGAYHNVTDRYVKENGLWKESYYGKRIPATFKIVNPIRESDQYSDEVSTQVVNQCTSDIMSFSADTTTGFETVNAVGGFVALFDIPFSPGTYSSEEQLISILGNLTITGLDAVYFYIAVQGLTGDNYIIYSNQDTTTYNSVNGVVLAPYYTRTWSYLELHVGGTMSLKINSHRAGSMSIPWSAFKLIPTGERFKYAAYR